MFNFFEALETRSALSAEMNTILHTHFDVVDSSLNSLVHAFTSTPAADAAPESFNSLLVTDDALASALKTLHTHQTNYVHILTLQAEADALASHIKSTIQRYHDTRNEAIDITGEEDSDSDSDSDSNEEDTSVPAKETIRHLEKDVNYTTLLNFAQRIARYNTTAEREATELAQWRKAEERTRNRKQKPEPKTVPAI